MGIYCIGLRHANDAPHERKRDAKECDMGGNNSLESLYENLSDEQKEQIKSMSSQELILAAMKEGVDLTAEQLKSINGGTDFDTNWSLGDTPAIREYSGDAIVADD